MYSAPAGCCFSTAVQSTGTNFTRQQWPHSTEHTDIAYMQETKYMNQEKPTEPGIASRPAVELHDLDWGA